MRTPKVIYQADVTNDEDDKYRFYYGLTESSFKKRFRKNTKLFNHLRYQNKTKLSKYICTLKHQNKTPTIKWKIVHVVISKVKRNFCKLFLTKKYYTISALRNPSLLKKRSKFIKYCWHKRKFLKFMNDSKD